MTYLRACTLRQPAERMPKPGYDPEIVRSDYPEQEDTGSDSTAKQQRTGRVPIRTPEPKPRDILISEFKDDRWML